MTISDSEAHGHELQRRAAIHDGGAPVPTNLCTLSRAEVADKHQWLTVVHALLTVEAGSAVTVWPCASHWGSGALGWTPMHHHIFGKRPGQMARAPDRADQGELMDANN